MNTFDRKEVISEIQNDLRVLYKSGIIRQQLTPTGVYDQQTVNAVKEFQRSAGLPDTGIIDYPTWVLLCDAAKDVKSIKEGPEPIYPFDQMRPGGSVSYGEKSDLVYFIQIMLKCLLRYDFEDLVITGQYDRATVEAVRRFQRANRLEATGSVDINTWNALADVYNRNITDTH